MSICDQVPCLLDDARAEHPFELLNGELVEGLALYWTTAAAILDGSGVTLADPPRQYLSLKKNFFTMLFLYSYGVAGIPSPRRAFYVAVNQCLRGMVTGCDNILDDEYKQTLDTDLPRHGTRFRSVLDIMVSDRILFHLLMTRHHDDGITVEQALAASAASLRSLTLSGAQEASEEGGIRTILTPDRVLQQVHHYKTGILFQCPWAAPAVLEKTIDEQTKIRLTDALYRIGMGCQLLDDMVDILRDLRQHRHNYFISLIIHGKNTSERSRLREAENNGTPSGEEQNLLSAFPQARRIGVGIARDYLETGVRKLYTPEHQFLVEPTLMFIARQIGADRFLSGE